jgi:hypothetical protein
VPAALSGLVRLVADPAVALPALAAWRRQVLQAILVGLCLLGAPAAVGGVASVLQNTPAEHQAQAWLISGLFIIVHGLLLAITALTRLPYAVRAAAVPLLLHVVWWPAPPPPCSISRWRTGRRPERDRRPDALAAGLAGATPLVDRGSGRYRGGGETGTDGRWRRGCIGRSCSPR